MRIQMCVLTLCLLAAACNRPATPKESSASQPVTSVKTAQPKKGSVARSIEQPGTVIAEQETSLYAKLPGYVEKYYFDIGARVNGPKYEILKSENGKPIAGKEISPGDLLADLAIPELHDEANQKSALKKQAEAELEQARQFLAIAKEQVVAMTALANETRFGVKRAEANFKRWESEQIRIAKLVKDKTIDLQIGDETQNQFLSAAATYNEAKARVITAEAQARKSEVERDKAEADIKVAEAKLQVAATEWDRLRNLLKYTKIRAPFDGIVTARYVDVRHFVQPLGNLKSVPLFTVMRVDKVRVVVDVPEADASLVQLGDEAQVFIPAMKGKPIFGKVSRTSGSLNPASRTLRTEIDFPNPDAAFSPGSYVSTRILTKLPERWLLPSTAVAKVGETMVCYLIDGGRTVRTPIETGRSDGKFIEVFKKAKAGTTEDWEDWTGNEIVANSNVAYLTDGQIVRVANEAEAAKK